MINPKQALENLKIAWRQAKLTDADNQVCRQSEAALDALLKEIDEQTKQAEEKK